MFDWDDLRVFLAAARAGALVTASRRLGIDAATVGRRIARLETRLNSTLFVRSRGGLKLTAVGAELFEAAVSVEGAMDGAWRVTRHDPVSGTVRISAAEGFGSTIIAPALGELVTQRPGLRIELAAHPGNLSPSRREVDMAVTLSPPEAARLVVEPLTGYQLALYAAPDYLARMGEPESIAELTDRRIVGYVDDLLYARELSYLNEISPGLAPTLASSSIQAQRAIIASGAGVGVLPCFLAEGLTRILAPQVLLERRFWIVTHQDVHETAPARAVLAWLRSLAADHKARLSPF